VTTFTLIVYLVLANGTTHRSTTVPGFKTAQACNDAGEALEKA
jgi:hypothetical protein